MENSRSERFIRFQLRTILSGVMKPRTIPSVLPGTLSRVSPPVSHFTAFSVIRSTLWVPQGLCSHPPYFTEQRCIHITFSTVCSNCSVLLLVIVLNLLLCPMYKLNIILGTYVGKTTVRVGFGTICGLRHPLGVLGCSPHG